MHDLLQQKAADVTQQMRECEQELAQLRPRMQYLEQMLLRCDGALSVLKQLLDTDTAAVPTPQPASNSQMAQPVAP